ncbi:DUF6879 family protein [Microbispora sp. NPDC049125]|uniref:DUF6879 family protein n=1 Tax=Microbispora sp. NPDC049125 TaxID=3154929 RepID=UPI00346618D3
MPGTVFEQVRRVEGVTLPAEEYGAELHEHLSRLEGVVWKLERAQHFHEPGVPSWVAMVDGDWDRAVALIGEMRFEDDLPPRAELRRLRVVETPLTPYLRWEAALLTARTRAGERARALDARAVRHLEDAAPLPELVVVGPDLMYEVLYDEIGAHTGARRITDSRLIEPCAQAIAAQYEEAEEMTGFYDREVAPLLPPTGTRT